MMTHPLTHQDLNTSLQRAFPFTEEDLEANRAGKLSATQRLHMRANQQTFSMMLWGCVGVGILFICVLISMLNIGSSRWSSNSTGDSGSLLLFVGLFGAGLLFLWSSQRKISDDLQVDTILSIQGRVTRQIIKSGSDQKRVFKVGEQPFNPSTMVYRAFVDGEFYVVYYSQASNKIISAEHIASNAYPDVVPEPLPATAPVEAPIARPVPEEEILSVNERLHRAFSTIDADLKANHDGHFSMSQQNRLYGKQLEGFLYVVAYIGIVALVVLVIVAGQIANGPITIDDGVLAFIILGVGIGLMLVSVPLVQITREMHSKHVIAIEGPVERHSDALPRSGLQPLIVIKGRSFRVLQEIYDAFSEPGVYVLYITPHSKTLMAAEHIPDFE